MFCSQCGKKVTENMLFCPFCGKPIVIPDQEPEKAESSAVPGAETEGARVGEVTGSVERSVHEGREMSPRSGRLDRAGAEKFARGAGEEPLRRGSEAAARDESVGGADSMFDEPRQENAEQARSGRATLEKPQVAARSERTGRKETEGFARSERWEEVSPRSERLAREEMETSLHSERPMQEKAGAVTRSERTGREETDAPPRSEPSVRAENFEDSSLSGGSQPMEARPTETDTAPRRGDAPSPGRGASKGLQIDWEEEERFRPLDLDDMDPEPAHEEPENPREELSELLSHRLREEPVRLKGRAPDLSNVHNPDRPGASSRRKASSYTPVRDFNPDDMFMDGDDYDEDDDDEEYAYEEPEEGGFFIRHIRGVVGLSLFVIVLAIVAGWAFSGGGQRVLAQANLAWQPSVYEQLGYEAYQNGQYAVAAGYYEQALRRNDRNYSYAYSAAVASYMAGDTEQAAEMGKRAVEIDATRVDGYQLLQRLYPDASARPWEIQSLIQQGYRLTGDASLNDAPQQ